MFLPCGSLVPAHRTPGTAGSSLGLQSGRAGLGAALGGCGAQAVHLCLGQLAILAGLEHSQLDDALGVPLQTDDLEAHGLAHPADLAVLALFQGHLHDGAARLVGDDVDGAGHGLGAVVQHDAGAELQDLCLIGPGLDGDAVELGDAAGRMGDSLCESAVVGHQQQALAVLVETAHGVQAGRDVGHQLHDRLAAQLIAGGGDIAAGLVQGQIIQLLILLDVDALIVQNPYAMGYLGIEQINTLLNGQKPEKKETATSSILVTRENMYDDKSQKALFSFEEK